jgi:hypothetical protein
MGSKGRRIFSIPDCNKIFIYLCIIRFATVHIDFLRAFLVSLSISVTKMLPPSMRKGKLLLEFRFQVILTSFQPPRMSRPPDHRHNGFRPVNSEDRPGQEVNTEC